MGKFSELRNIRNSVILEVNGEYRTNLAEIEKQGTKEEAISELEEEPTDNAHKLTEEFDTCSKDVVKVEERRKVEKYKTIKKKLTEVFALLQRPKRKPLREFFVDEEEELESKFTCIHLFRFRN